jgi:hypothetical protein
MLILISKGNISLSETKSQSRPIIHVTNSFYTHTHKGNKRQQNKWNHVSFFDSYSNNLQDNFTYFNLHFIIYQSDFLYNGQPKHFSGLQEALISYSHLCGLIEV